MDQVRETAKESVRMLLEDLRALPNEDEIFQGKGARTREAWLSIARASQSQLMAPPKSDGGLPEIR